MYVTPLFVTLGTPVSGWLRMDFTCTVDTCCMAPENHAQYEVMTQTLSQRGPQALPEPHTEGSSVHVLARMHV